MEKLTTIYLTKDINGNIAIFDYPFEGTVAYTKVDEIKRLVGKAYAAGLDNRAEGQVEGLKA